MLYTQLRAFDAVARYGGFVAAAENLGLTQPAISVQVRTLEEAYGVKLFNRRDGKVHQTGTGRKLFALTREMFAVEDRVQDFLKDSKDLELGDLRLSVDGPHLAMSLIAAFRKRYPKIRLAVSSGNATTVWRDLIDGRADVVVVANPPDDPRVVIMPVRESGLHVLVACDHPWSTTDTIRVDRLAGQPLILREAHSNTRQTVDRVLQDCNLVPDISMELVGREATLEAVAAGLGTGFVFAHEVRADNRVRSIPLTGAKFKNLDTVATLNSHRARGVVAAFFDVVGTWRAATGHTET